MPKLGNKVKAINYLVEKCCLELFICEESDEEEEILSEAIDELAMVVSMRYCVPFISGSVPKSKEWWMNILPSYDDSRFKIYLRVSRQQFSFILNEIESDPTFNQKQFPVERQLAILLYRLGCSGEGGTIAKIAALFGCGDGGTIDKVSKRVMRAIIRKKTKFLHWPQEQERKEIVAATMHELPHCIGYLDGSEIRLAEKPSVDWESFYSRKQNYSIKAQVVCDHQLRIRHLVVGPPGSVHDNRILLNSSLWLQKHRFVSDMQWLAADTAYNPPSSLIICPFKRPMGGQLTATKTAFNSKLSSFRVRIEHCFGIVKEVFSSLKELRINITGVETLQYASAWVTVCCVLHNMMIECSGLDTDTYDLVRQLLQDAEDDDDGGNNNSGVRDNTAGETKRKALMEVILNL